MPSWLSSVFASGDDVNLLMSIQDIPLGTSKPEIINYNKYNNGYLFLCRYTWVVFFLNIECFIRIDNTYSIFLLYLISAFHI